MQDSSSNWDGAKSTQSFTGMDHGKFIAQNVQVHPTSGTPEVEEDTLNLWSSDNCQYGVVNNKFMKPAFGGRATLSQTGSVHADYDFAKQWSNIGGSSGSKIESWNNLNWVNFEQMLMFTK